MNLSNEDVQDILRVLDSTRYDELKLETARFSLVLRRSATGSWTQEVQALGSAQRSDSADRAVATAVGTPAPAEAATARAARAAGAAQQGLHEVRPPMIGTFYRAPKPGAEPFVVVGSKVRPETVVCIVETMKLMNSVYAGVAGEVVEICLEDAQFADEGEVLIRIRPEAS